MIYAHRLCHPVITNVGLTRELILFDLQGSEDSPPLKSSALSTDDYLCTTIIDQSIDQWLHD